MLDNARRIFLFVGMVVGAGFATGRELMLYFYGANAVSVVFAGILMGVFFTLFLLIGASQCYSRYRMTFAGKVVDVIMYIATLLSFVVMTAGAEELLGEVCHAKFLGAISSIFAVIIASLGMRRVKNLNLLIVPILLILVLGITLGNCGEIVGNLRLYNSIKYVSLNMLTAGYLIVEEGENVTKKDAVICGSIVSVIFAIILYFIVSRISLYHSHSMPMYQLAVNSGVGMMGAGIIFLAIFSTLLGDAKIIYDKTHLVIGNKYVVIALMVVIAIISSRISFATAVDRVYSLLGIVGIAFEIYAIITYLLRYRVDKRQHIPI